MRLYCGAAVLRGQLVWPLRPSRSPLPCGFLDGRALAFPRSAAGFCLHSGPLVLTTELAALLRALRCLLTLRIALEQLMRSANADKNLQRKRDVIKKVIAYMTLGIDVVRCLQRVRRVRAIAAHTPCGHRRVDCLARW